MEIMGLDKVLKNKYDNLVLYIKSKNVELEREYFTKNANRTPMNEIMQGASYEDHFMNFKEIVKNANENEVSQIFMLLQDYFLFSKGHDMMFKKKLEADIFTSVPMDNLIYPRLSEAVKEKYNDVSVMSENPNQSDNLKGIDTLIFTYADIQSLLYLLYCHEFHFPNGWEEICTDNNHEEILNILNDSGMTIGDFLHALIDFKCQIMSEIFSEINDSNRKRSYLEQVESLKKAKHKETETFSHVALPITYFLDHTNSDFINTEHKSPILEDRTPNKVQKIFLPR